MKLLTVCALMGLGVVAFVALRMSDDRLSSSDALLSAADEIVGTSAAIRRATGFTPIPMPDQGIIIFAPRNCPSDAAQRAEAVAQYLSGKGIAFARQPRPSTATWHRERRSTR